MHPVAFKLKQYLFWQPPLDLLSILLTAKSGRFLFIILNYFIWPFLAYLSFILVTTNPNIFWQILSALVLSVLIEYSLKSFLPWKRPISQTKNVLPFKLEQRWALRGSFPSGHTAKTLIYFLFITQYHVFSPITFLLINIPLIASRIILGLHYPIDILGGLLTGWTVWLVIRYITFPPILTNLVRDILNLIFNYVF